MVGVNDPLHGTLHLRRLGIDEGQRVSQRVGNDERLLVRGEVEMVGLFAG